MSGDRAHPRLDRHRIGHHRHGLTAVSWTDSWTEIADTHRGALTTVTTVQTNRLRALLLGGEDVDRRLARGRLTDAALTAAATGEPVRVLLPAVEAALTTPL